MWALAAVVRSRTGTWGDSHTIGNGRGDAAGSRTSTDDEPEATARRSIGPESRPTGLPARPDESPVDSLDNR